MKKYTNLFTVAKGDTMKIGEYIKELRETKKFSINQLALYAEVSPAHISRIERGLRDASPDILKKLYPHLGVSYDDLMDKAGYRDRTKKEEIADDIIQFLISKGIVEKDEQLSDEKRDWLLKLLDKAIDMSRLK